MLTSLNWLKEFVDIDINSNDFADAMTMSGTKVEAVETLGVQINGVVVGKIIEINSHPDADKLVITSVDIGDEKLQIVTGAKNIAVGDYVPVAKIGATLANDIKIKKSKLRGKESYGMLCSVEELGMNTSLFLKQNIEGIYIFKEEFPLGCDVKPIMGLDDTIIEFELTANRSDCQSIVGIAREVSATLNKHLLLPVINVEEKIDNISNYIKVNVKNSNLCPRYVARMVKVNKIEQSPSWMQRKLLNSGVRPINNIVDVTNFVMLELGQPLHAFDYEKLESKEIIVRNANEGESITTLDNIKREIDTDMLMIADGDKPVAIAGVMGGGNSEVDNETKIIVLESANFDKTNIRLTSKKIGLRTESSSRFEKGIDPDLADLAIDRAAQLLEEIGAGEVIKGKIDHYPKPVNRKEINVDANWINKFVGINISIEKMAEYLERLFLNVNINGDTLEVIVPTYRQDLEIKEDLAEEIARLYGYNNIPNTIMSGVTIGGGKTEKQRIEDSIKTILVEKGAYEILTSSFTSKSKLMSLNLMDNDERLDAIKVTNPLGEENSLMRTTLISHMLQVISHNYNRKIDKGLFYEISTTYQKTLNLGDQLPKEIKTLCIGTYGDVDFYSLKGYIELILNKLRIENIEYEKINVSEYHPQRGASITINDEILGTIGEVHPKVVENYSLPRRTYICEINMEKLYKYSNKEINYIELPKYPGITRDIALLIEDNITARDIEKVIKLKAGDLLESINIFDVYKGSQIPEGHKSIAYSIDFRAKDRTLTDNEINEIYKNIITECEETLGAKLRD